MLISKIEEAISFFPLYKTLDLSITHCATNSLSDLQPQTNINKELRRKQALRDQAPDSQDDNDMYLHLPDL